MSKKFKSNEVVESLINGQFKQAREQTLEGLTDVYFEDVTHSMPYQSRLFSVGSEDLENVFKELAHRVCSVIIHITRDTLFASHDKHELAVTYQKLFTSGRVTRTSEQDKQAREDFDSAMEGWPY